MATQTHGREPYPVTHTLDVTGLDTPQEELQITQALEDLEGMMEVEANWLQGQVSVTYDLNRLNLQEVERVMQRLGFPLDDHLLARVKREIMHFTEQNELENLQFRPQLPNQPPNHLI